MDLRGTVGSIYKREYFTLVHTTYESSGPYGFGEEDFFYVFPIVSLRELLTPRGGAFSDPRDMHGSINVIPNIEALAVVVSEKNIFFHIFSIVSLWQIMLPPGRGLY